MSFPHTEHTIQLCGRSDDKRLKAREFLQDHNAVLITTESDRQYELDIKGLEKHFLRRAAPKGLQLPW